ncbi:hypothetical protein F5Y12DRAFT_787590 [Xylaria sp. FL1777]|nr:hypothetical protein F5Y12DRAFT_787590 [Xylaria sp. FL1777]
MPTASGFIKGVAGGNKFTATFVINDITSVATLRYTDVGQLTAQRNFDGKIGTKEILLTIKNGPAIRGPLDLPIDPASRVAGNGTWAQN